LYSRFLFLNNISMRSIVRRKSIDLSLAGTADALACGVTVVTIAKPTAAPPVLSIQFPFCAFAVELAAARVHACRCA
jgi:hypothetical protein